MLVIAKMGKKSAYYYVNLAQAQGEFSSAKAGEPPGEWFGQGAERLGLAEQVTREAFLSLFEGFSTDHATKLVENAGGKRRVPGWDLTFTPPKSVTILWVVFDALTRIIEKIHHEAVRRALSYLEHQTHLLQSETERVGLVVACFEHGSNRAQEPNLHTHALVLNIGVTENNQTGAIDSNTLYKHKMAAGALYRSELSYLLQYELGLSLERCQRWFEVAGFSREGGKYQALMNLWSSRRRAIEAQQPLTAAQAQTVAYQTRAKKGRVPPRDELFARWQAQAIQHGLGPKQARKLIQEGRERTTLWQRFQEWRAFREARRLVVQHQSHFRKCDLVRAIAEAAQTRGINGDRVLELTETFLTHRQVMSLGVLEKEERFTLKRLYKMEQHLLSQAAKLERDRSARVSLRQVERAATKHGLTQEQRRALQTITDRGGIKVIKGISGTGKTQTLVAAANAFWSSGYEVIAVSQSGRGAERLHEAGIGNQGRLSKLLFGETERSITLQKLFYEIDKADDSKRRYGSRSVVEPPVSKNTIVMVDHAQTLSTTQMTRLIEAVKASGGKLILCGDIKAPQAFEHSGAFSAIAQKVASVTLTEIKRQETEQSRELVQTVGFGRLAAVVETLQKNGVLLISETRDEAIAQLLNDWSEHAVRKPKEHLIIVDSRDDANFLNQLAQEKLQASSALSEKSVRVGDIYFHKGERVIFQETSPTYGITKGATGTIERLEPLTKVAWVRMDSGKSRLINLRHYRSVDLAYAVTVTQARDVETHHAYVLTQGTGRDLGLIQVSRAKVSMKIYSVMSKHEQEYVNPHWKISSQIAFQKEHDLAVSIQQQAEAIKVKQQ